MLTACKSDHLPEHVRPCRRPTLGEILAIDHFLGGFTEVMTIHLTGKAASLSSTNAATIGT